MEKVVDCCQGMVKLEVVLLTFSWFISTFPLSFLHLFFLLHPLHSLHFPQATAWCSNSELYLMIATVKLLSSCTP